MAGSLEIRLLSLASHAIPLGLMWWSRHAAKLWRMPRRLSELDRALKATSRPARM
jgi:hypothetical protein